MFSVSLIKIKFLTILSMVFMGLFSRLVLGLPLLLQTSSPTFHPIPEKHQFPDGGNRTSLRLLPASRCAQKRRHARKDGRTLEEELTLFQSDQENYQLDLIGEVIEEGGEDFYSAFQLERH